MSEDGVYSEGGGYRNYYADSEYQFYATYKSVMGEWIFSKYSLANESLLFTPYAASPVFRYPQMCVSYANYVTSMFSAQSLYTPGTVERQVVDYYINNSLLRSWGFPTEWLGYLDYERILIYTFSSGGGTPDAESSHRSSTGFYTILRSGWSERDIYSYFKGKHEPSFSGHQNGEPDGLTFDLFAKRAYLIADASDERFLGYLGNSQGYAGHTSWRTHQSSQDDFLAHAMGERSMYQDSDITNPTHIDTFISSDVIDFAKGYSRMSRLGTYPYYDPDVDYTAHRALALMGDEYLVDFTSFRSDSSTPLNIQHIIPFASTELVNPVEGTTIYDNRFFGNLTLDGSIVPWFDEAGPWTSDQTIESDTSNVEEIVWSTISQTDSDNPTPHKVNLTVHLNPTSDVGISHVGMHLGDYGRDFEGAIPVAQFNVSGVNATALVVYYPRNGSEEIPEISQKTVSGGTTHTYATEINKSSSSDIAWVSEGIDFSAGYISSDADYGLVRLNTTSNKVDEAIFGSGTYFSLLGEQILQLNKEAPAVMYMRLSNSQFVVKIANSTSSFTVKLKNLPVFASASVFVDGSYVADTMEDGNTTVRFPMAVSGTSEALVTVGYDGCTWQDPPVSGDWEVTSNNYCYGSDLEVDGVLTVSNGAIFSVNEIDLNADTPLILNNGVLDLTEATFTLEDT
jgi:hypothetical protein